MSEFIKESIRLFLYPFFLLSGGTVSADVGSLKFYFLCWLYGEFEEQHDGWIYPESEKEK